MITLRIGATYQSRDGVQYIITGVDEQFPEESTLRWDGHKVLDEGWAYCWAGDGRYHEDSQSPLDLIREVLTLEQGKSYRDRLGAVHTIAKVSDADADNILKCQDRTGNHSWNSSGDYLNNIEHELDLVETVIVDFVQGNMYLTRSGLRYKFLCVNSNLVNSPFKYGFSSEIDGRIIWTDDQGNYLDGARGSAYDIVGPVPVTVHIHKWAILGRNKAGDYGIAVFSTPESLAKGLAARPSALATFEIDQDVTLGEGL